MEKKGSVTGSYASAHHIFKLEFFGCLFSEKIVHMHWSWLECLLQIHTFWLIIWFDFLQHLNLYVYISNHFFISLCSVDFGMTSSQLAHWVECSGLQEKIPCIVSTAAPDIGGLSAPFWCNTLLVSWNCFSQCFSDCLVGRPFLNSMFNNHRRFRFPQPEYTHYFSWRVIVYIVLLKCTIV